MTRLQATFIPDPTPTIAPDRLDPGSVPFLGTEDSRGKLPPPPEASSSKLWQAIRFTADPFSYLAQVRAEKGDLFVLHLPGLGPVTFLCSASLLNEVYKHSEEKIVAGRIRRSMVGHLTGALASLSIDGQAYADRRRIMAPFFSGKSLHRHAPSIRRSTEEAIGRWPWDRSFRLCPSLAEITLRTICRILYGPLEKKTTSELLHLSGRFLEAFRSSGVHVPFLRRNLGRRSPWGKFLAVRQELREKVGREILRRSDRDIAQGEDLISGFLAAQNDRSPDEVREILIQEILSLLVGGAETTATVLSWTLTGLLSDRAVLDRLRREVYAVLGETPIESAHLKELPYLDAVVQEGMRFQSVAPFAGPRLAEQDIELGGFAVPAGSLLVQCLSEVARSPTFPNPDRFDPENFYARHIKARDWVPFGGGSRVCTGMGLARLELAVVVATIVQRTDLKLVPGSLRPVRRGITYVPKNGLRVRRVC